MVKKKDNRIYTVAQAVEAGMKYCAYQERCQHEVFNYLYTKGADTEIANAALAELIAEGFVNEERFAKTFASGKFRIKKWGKRKIRFAMMQKHIPDPCIEAGLAEIDDEEYRSVLTETARKKSGELGSEPPAVKRAKLFRFLMSRGFEPGLTDEILNKTLKEND